MKLLNVLVIFLFSIAESGKYIIINLTNLFYT